MPRQRLNKLNSLAALIRASGLSQREVSRTALIGESRLSAICRGRVKMSADEAARLAEALGQPVERILDPLGGALPSPEELRGNMLKALSGPQGPALASDLDLVCRRVLSALEGA